MRYGAIEYHWIFQFLDHFPLYGEEFKWLVKYLPDSADQKRFEEATVQETNMTMENHHFW